MIFATYGNVYVARVAFGANPQQTLLALREAEDALAALVGEHSGVTWKFVNWRPPAARPSTFGVSMSEP